MRKKILLMLMLGTLFSLTLSTFAADKTWKVCEPFPRNEEEYKARLQAVAQYLNEAQAMRNQRDAKEAQNAAKDKQQADKDKQQIDKDKQQVDKDAQQIAKDKQQADKDKELCAREAKVVESEKKVTQGYSKIQFGASPFSFSKEASLSEREKALSDKEQKLQCSLILLRQRDESLAQREVNQLIHELDCPDNRRIDITCLFDGFVEPVMPALPDNPRDPVILKKYEDQYGQWAKDECDRLDAILAKVKKTHTNRSGGSDGTNPGGGGNLNGYDNPHH